MLSEFIHVIFNEGRQSYGIRRIKRALEKCVSVLWQHFPEHIFN